MLKADVIQFFGGRELVAHALDISGGAVEKWPNKLTSTLAAKVFAAAIQRFGVKATRKAFPEMFEA